MSARNLMALFGRFALVAALAGVTSVAVPARSSHAQGAGLDSSLELVDPNVLRVCADPRNLPFSNEKGEGFENSSPSFWRKSSTGSLPTRGIRNRSGSCATRSAPIVADVIPGFPQGDELVQSTNPYYRTAYAFVVRRATGSTTLIRSPTPASRQNASASSPARRPPRISPSMACWAKPSPIRWSSTRVSIPRRRR